MRRSWLLATLAISSLVRTTAFRSGASKVIRTGQHQSSGLDAVQELSPVQRVVGLLTKMKGDLEEETKKETEMYNKMVCWCQSSSQEKTGSVNRADTRSSELASEVNNRNARYGNLAASSSALQTQIGRDITALKQATAIRERQKLVFDEAEEDLARVITNLKNAILVLTRQQGQRQSLLQLDASLVSGIRVLLRDAAVRYELMRAGAQEQREGGPRSVTALLQMGEATDAPAPDDEELRQQLQSALDVHGPSISQTLSLGLAERLVAESLHLRRGLASGSSLLQDDSHQPASGHGGSRAAGYGSRAGTAVGVMEQMLQQFQLQLQRLQDVETKAVADYQALAGSKDMQISVARERLDELQADASANIKSLSDAREDLALARRQRAVDADFLRKTRLACKDLDKEWERRSATRTAELQAVSETIAILSEDESRERLAKTAVSLMQLQQQRGAAAAASAAERSGAAALLRSAAKLLPDEPGLETDDLLAAWRRSAAAGPVGPAPPPPLPASAGSNARARLSSLALAAELDSFGKVRRMIETLLGELKTQQKEEVDFKAYCNSELSENEKAIRVKTRLRGDQSSKLETLAALVEKLTKEIAETKGEMAATRTQVKQASETREAENKAFQETVTDQREARSILKKALARLEDYYKKGIGKKVIYLQRHLQAPPSQFRKYRDHSGGSPVMGLLQQIISDSNRLEEDAMAGENEAQLDYEAFVKDSNAVVAELSDTVSLKSKALADAKLEKTESDSDLDSTIAELEHLAAYDADLHGQCDFVLKNFETRQSARLQEMEAIQSAKAILAGSAESR